MDSLRPARTIERSLGLVGLFSCLIVFPFPIFVSSAVCTLQELDDIVEVTIGLNAVYSMAFVDLIRIIMYPLDNGSSTLRWGRFRRTLANSRKV